MSRLSSRRVAIESSIDRIELVEKAMVEERESIAFIGDVKASGTTLNVQATTGEARGSNGISMPGMSAPGRAAEANIIAGTVGVGAISVGVADVKLESTARAASVGQLSFAKTTIDAQSSAAMPMRRFTIQIAAAIPNSREA